MRSRSPSRRGRSRCACAAAIPTRRSPPGCCTYWEAVGGGAETEQVTALEQAAFAVDHAEVGAWLFEAWNLPTAIVEAVRQHHDPDPKPGLAALLAATNSLTVWTDFGSGTVRPEGAAVFAAQGERGVTEEVWMRLVSEVHQSGGAGTFGAFGS
jgi:HDOD domain-containing protein